MKLMITCLFFIFTLQNIIVFSAENLTNQLSILISTSNHTNNKIPEIQALLNQDRNLRVGHLIEDLTEKFDKALCKSCCLTGFTILCAAEVYSAASNNVSFLLPTGLSILGLKETLQRTAQLRHQQVVLSLLVDHENKQKIK